MNYFKIHAVGFVTAAMVCGSATLSVAQTDSTEAASSDEFRLAPITITARKRVEDANAAPLSVSVFTGDDLQAQGIISTDQVLNRVPNASQSGGIGGTLQGLVSIRGISTLVRFVGLETGVGYYVDGVYVGRPENFSQDLLDIQRVEILRGPQGALFGRNTIAGAINIVTQTPESYMAKGELTVGNYDLLRARAQVHAPLVKDKLFGSFAVSQTKRDGFVENVGTGDDLDDADLTTYRGKLRWTPTSQAEFVLSADALRDRGQPAFFETLDVSFLEDETETTPFTVNADQPNFLDRDIWGASLMANIDLAGGTWTSLIAHRDTSFDAGLDDDKLPVRYFVDFFGSDSQFDSIETRYTNTLGDRLTYLAGLYYFSQDADNESNFALGEFLTGFAGVEPPIDLTSSVDTESIAAFFNLDYALTDRLSLEVGGRYVEEEKRASHVQEDQTGLFGSTEFSRERTDQDFSPIVSLTYRTPAGPTVFARYAEGYKSAGFNTDFITAGANLEVEPEHARSVEIGLKSRLLDGRAQLNMAAFATEYEDLQLAQIASAGVSLNNAAEAEIVGLEVDLTALVSEHLQVNGALGLLDATYTDFPGCPAPGAAIVATVENCDGKFLNLAPEVSAQFGAQFTYPLPSGLEWVSRLDVNYRDEVYFEPQNTERLSGDARTLLNLRTSLVSQAGWEIEVWGENVTDETYVNYADDRSAIYVNTTAAYGAPQTYGVTLRVTF